MINSIYTKYKELNSITNLLNESFKDTEIVNKRISRTETDKDINLKIELQGKKTYKCSEIENVDNPKYNPIEEAYNILVRARDSGSYSDVDLDMIIGYLGEALE
jgi:hypothetical protein